MKSLKISVLLVILSGFVSSVAFAQENTDFSVKELGVERVGLLPSNPFYFLKEFRRDIRKFLTFKELGKLEIELEVANEKAAELRKLDEITPENADVLKGAVENYRAHLDLIQTRLTDLKDTTQNQELDRLINILVGNSLRHYEVLNAILLNPNLNVDLRSAIGNLQNQIMVLLASVTIRIDPMEKFGVRLEKLLATDVGGISDLKAAEFLEVLEEKTDGSRRAGVAVLKENFLIKLAGQLESGAVLPGEVSLLDLFAVDAGNRQLRLIILEELREKLINPDIKTELNILRQRLLNEIYEEEGINRDRALLAIEAAKASVSDLEVMMGDLEGGFGGSVKLLVERAKFNLAQAEALYDQENFSGSLGQAIAAFAVSEDARNQLSVPATGWSGQADALKAKYDRLLNKAKIMAGKEGYSRILALLKDAEKRIIDLSAAIRANKSRPEKLNSAIRGIKLTLAVLDNLLR